MLTEREKEDVIIAEHELLRAMIKVEMLNSAQFAELENRITMSGYDIDQARALIAFLRDMRKWTND